MAKQIIIIAGPNGAGKTTFARSFLPGEAHLTRFINADLIAAGLAPFAPETAAIKAARLMLEEIDQCVRRGESFAFETTLSGQGYLRHIVRWRAQGYRVSVLFLTLPDADSAVARVVERVRQGGHDIPESVIRRRFAVGWNNFIDTTSRLWTTGLCTTMRTPNPYCCNGEKIDEATRHLRGAGPHPARIAASDQARGATGPQDRLARKIAIQTDTAIVVVKDGKLVRITADELRKQQSGGEPDR